MKLMLRRRKDEKMHEMGEEREEVKETRQFSSLLGRLKGPLIRAKLNITSCLEGLVSDREVTG